MEPPPSNQHDMTILGFTNLNFTQKNRASKRGRCCGSLDKRPKTSVGRGFSPSVIFRDWLSGTVLNKQSNILNFYRDFFMQVNKETY